MSRTVLRTIARVRRFQRLKAEQQAANPRRRFTRIPPLLDFIPALSSRYQAPRHLTRLCTVLERALHEPIEVCVSVPPRHAKTTTIIHWIVWCLLHDPTLTIAYVSHSGGFAAKQCRRAMSLAIQAGIRLGAKQTESEWETAAGGGMKAVGIGGQLTGEGFRIVVVDDPHKNRQEAESPAARARVLGSFQADIYTRQDPAGTSFVVVHQRWHDDDLIGNLERGLAAGDAGADEEVEPFEVVNLPAENDNGRPLWPERWPAAKLRKIRLRIGPYNYVSLFMGRPQPKGGRLFELGATRYRLRDLPAIGRDGCGIDLAYTKKTKRHWSVALTGRRAGPDLYLTGMIRKQCRAPEFARDLEGIVEGNPGILMRWYCGAAEVGGADLLVDRGIPLEVCKTTLDKFQRAQRAAAAWNHPDAGRILVPVDVPWAEELIREVRAFTGEHDATDDIVDALAALWDLLDEGSDSEWDIETGGQERMAAGLRGR